MHLTAHSYSTESDFLFWFQNKDNKVLIAPRAVQFWSEINLVKINRASASRSCDFVITRLISDQIALHSITSTITIIYQLNETAVIILFVEVNECLEAKNVCDKNAICIDTPGSYKCRCKTGYHKKNGKECIKGMPCKHEQ